MRPDDLNRITSQVAVINELLADQELRARLAHPSTLDTLTMLRYYAAILADFCESLPRANDDQEFWQIVLPLAVEHNAGDDLDW
jgi:hypothetical protein